MMRSLTVVAVVAVLAGCSKSKPIEAGAPAASPFESLSPPNGLLAYAGVREPEAFLGRLAEAVSRDFPGVPDLRAVILDKAAYGGAFAVADLTRPMALGVFEGPPGAKPLVFVVLHKRGAIPDEPMFHDMAGYLVVSLSNDLSAVPADFLKALASETQHHDVTLVVNMAGIGERYGESVAQGLAMLRQAWPMPGMQGIWDFMSTVFNGFVAQTHALVIGGDLTDEAWSLEFTYEAKQGSSAAGLFSGSNPFATDELRQLPRGSVAVLGWNNSHPSSREMLAAAAEAMLGAESSEFVRRTSGVMFAAYPVEEATGTGLEVLYRLDTAGASAREILLGYLRSLRGIGLPLVENTLLEHEYDVDGTPVDVVRQKTTTSIPPTNALAALVGHTEMHYAIEGDRVCLAWGSKARREITAWLKGQRDGLDLDVPGLRWALGRALHGASFFAWASPVAVARRLAWSSGREPLTSASVPAGHGLMMSATSSGGRGILQLQLARDSLLELLALVLEVQQSLLAQAPPTLDPALAPPVLPTP